MSGLRGEENYQQFLVALGTLPKHGWIISWGVAHQGPIRLWIDTGHVCCPLTAVCEQQTGRRHDIGHWRQAAEDIGLDLEIARAIALGADNAYGFDVWRGDLLGALGAPD